MPFQKHLSPHKFGVSTFKSCEIILFDIRILLDLHPNWVVMQIDIENAFNSVFWANIFKELWDVRGPLANIVLLTKLFYGVHYFLYYQHGQREEGVTIIESLLGMRQGDPFRGLLFALTHYRALLETIAWTPNYVFPSLTDNTYIMGPMNEIILAVDHLSTELTLVGFKVKVSKCKLCSPSRIPLSIKIPHGYTLVTNGLHILGVC